MLALNVWLLMVPFLLYDDTDSPKNFRNELDTIISHGGDDSSGGVFYRECC